MHAASTQLKQPSATLFVCASAIRRNEMGEVQLRPFFEHLHSLASSGQHPLALVVQGLLLEKEGSSERALTQYDKAVSTSTVSGTQDGYSHEILQKLPGFPHILDKIPSPWLARGKLKEKLGDLEGAGADYEIAAEKVDEPEAQLPWAKQLRASSAERETALTKAALSGQNYAFHELGKHFLQRSLEQKEQLSPWQQFEKNMRLRLQLPFSPSILPRLQATALEWFNLGRDQNLLTSQSFIYAAFIERQSGVAVKVTTRKFHRGLAAIEELYPTHADLFANLKALWEDPGVNFFELDLSGLDQLQGKDVANYYG